MDATYENDERVLREELNCPHCRKKVIIKFKHFNDGNSIDEMNSSITIRKLRNIQNGN